MQEQTDQAILQQLRAGGARRQSAISQLYSQYSARIKRYYINHRASPADADDWVQDSFIKLVRSIDSFRGDAPLSAWIWTIARNVMLDALRKKNPAAPAEEALLAEIADTAATAIEHIQGEELEECVRKRFAEFQAQEPERAQCIVWAVIDGLRMAEIATIMERTAGATREYLSQCRKKLRTYLAPCLELV